MLRHEEVCLGAEVLMKPVVFHGDAEAELDDALAYYESGRKGLGLSSETAARILVAPQTLMFPSAKTSGNSSTRLSASATSSSP